MNELYQAVLEIRVTAAAIQQIVDATPRYRLIYRFELKTKIMALLVVADWFQLKVDNLIADRRRNGVGVDRGFDQTDHQSN